MQIRSANIDDADAAVEVIRRSIRDLCGLDHNGDPATLAMWLENKTAANMRRWIGSRTVLVAVKDEKIGGVAAARADGEVILNYVAPEARFQGISKALMQGIELWAQSQQLERMTLESSTTAIRFYLSMGWVANGPSRPGFGVTTCNPMTKIVMPRPAT